MLKERYKAVVLMHLLNRPKKKKKGLLLMMHFLTHFLITNFL